MNEILHILAGEYEYEETLTIQGPDGRPYPEVHGVPVEVTVCGREDYRGNLDFAYPADKATCSNCIDEYALTLLNQLNNDDDE